LAPLAVDTWPVHATLHGATRNEWSISSAPTRGRSPESPKQRGPLKLRVIRLPGDQGSRFGSGFCFSSAVRSLIGRLLQHVARSDSEPAKAPGIAHQQQCTGAGADDCFAQRDLAEAHDRVGDDPAFPTAPAQRALATGGLASSGTGRVSRTQHSFDRRALPSHRANGSPVFRSSGWCHERRATRPPDPPRSPRPGAGTTNAPTAPRNRERSRVRTRRFRLGLRVFRPRNRCGAYGDSRSRARSVKSALNLSCARAVEAA